MVITDFDSVSLITVSCSNLYSKPDFVKVITEAVEMKIRLMGELEGWYESDLDLTGQSLRLTATNYAYLYY